VWRFIDCHERCLAAAAGADEFHIVTTVPSSDQQRDEAHPLRGIVGELVGPTRDRNRRLLRRSGTPVPDRAVDPGKYNATEDLAGGNVLLIDDTWTTGANVQSAAGALKTSGAGRVGALVIGRHIHEDYQDNAQRLKALPRPFDWGDLRPAPLINHLSARDPAHPAQVSRAQPAHPLELDAPTHPAQPAGSLGETGSFCPVSMVFGVGVRPLGGRRRRAGDATRLSREERRDTDQGAVDIGASQCVTSPHGDGRVGGRQYGRRVGLVARCTARYRRTGRHPALRARRSTAHAVAATLAHPPERGARPL
jgi:hypothetical protein